MKYHAHVKYVADASYAITAIIEAGARLTRLFEEKWTELWDRIESHVDVAAEVAYVHQIAAAMNGRTVGRHSNQVDTATLKEILAARDAQDEHSQEVRGRLVEGLVEKLFSLVGKGNKILVDAYMADIVM